MTLRQLEFLLSIAHWNSFTRAAAELHISQPALSVQLRLLEEELGCRLLERLPRGVRLTAEGRSFLPEAEAVVAAAERARRLLSNVTEGEAGVLRIGTVLSLSIGVLPVPLAKLRRERPELSVELVEYEHRDSLEQGVSDAHCDVAVGPRPVDWYGHVEHLGWEEFVVVVASDDPLAASVGPVDLRLLADRDWVLFSQKQGLSPFVYAACARAGFAPRGRLRTSQVSAAARLAAAGAGPAMVPANVLEPGFGGVALQLQDPVLRELAVFSRDATPGPLLLTLVEALRLSRDNLQLVARTGA
ncbi:MAG: LysR family transcriptional regulator [Frankiales bacterium]|nr:LysR family transcriptional regulator [Frankiales bacterium]